MSKDTFIFNFNGNEPKEIIEKVEHMDVRINLTKQED